MKVRVLYEDNKPQDKTFEIIEGRVYVFGRDDDCDFILNDVQTSRHHFSIDTTGSIPVIRDLGSSNGTIINGKRCKKHELDDDDIIISGECRLRFEVTDADSSISSVDLVDGSSRDISTSVRHRYTPEKWDFSDSHTDEEVGKMRRQLDKICYLAGRIFSEKSRADIFRIALDTAMDLTGAERASALLVDESNNKLMPVFARLRDKETSATFPVSKTIIAETMKNGDSVISDCVLDDARFNNSESVSEQRLNSVMCVPLMTLKEEIIGVLYLESTNPSRKFGGQDLTIFAAIGYQAAVAIERTRLIDDMERLFFGSILSLAASIEAKDVYTKGHSERVTCYSLIIADELGLSEKDRTIVELAGIMHDVGKVGVPEAILCHPGKISEDDFTMIRQHPERGSDIISKMPNIAGVAPIMEVALATRHHHEKYDGTGYPDGLSGEKIPLAARILAVADTFDAITSDRSYRKGRSAESALKILGACAGTQVDQDVLAAFERAYDKGLVERAGKIKSHLNFNASELLSPVVAAN